jgi:hypothetical protein
MCVGCKWSLGGEPRYPGKQGMLRTNILSKSTLSAKSSSRWDYPRLQGVHSGPEGIPLFSQLFFARALGAWISCYHLELLLPLPPSCFPPYPHIDSGGDGKEGVYVRGKCHSICKFCWIIMSIQSISKLWPWCMNLCVCLSYDLNNVPRVLRREKKSFVGTAPSKWLLSFRNGFPFYSERTL